MTKTQKFVIAFYGAAKVREIAHIEARDLWAAEAKLVAARPDVTDWTFLPR